MNGSVCPSRWAYSTVSPRFGSAARYQGCGPPVLNSRGSSTIVSDPVKAFTSEAFAGVVAAIILRASIDRWPGGTRMNRGRASMYSLSAPVPSPRSFCCHLLPGFRQRGLADHGGRADVAVVCVEERNPIGEVRVGKKHVVDDGRFQIGRALSGGA